MQNAKEKLIGDLILTYFQLHMEIDIEIHPTEGG